MATTETMNDGKPLPTFAAENQVDLWKNAPIIEIKPEGLLMWQATAQYKEYTLIAAHADSPQKALDNLMFQYILTYAPAKA